MVLAITQSMRAGIGENLAVLCGRPEIQAGRVVDCRLEFGAGSSFVVGPDSFLHGVFQNAEIYFIMPDGNNRRAKISRYSHKLLDNITLEALIGLRVERAEEKKEKKFSISQEFVKLFIISARDICRSFGFSNNEEKLLAMTHSFIHNTTATDTISKNEVVFEFLQLVKKDFDNIVVNPIDEHTIEEILKTDPNLMSYYIIAMALRFFTGSKREKYDYHDWIVRKAKEEGWQLKETA